MEDMRTFWMTILQKNKSVNAQEWSWSMDSRKHFNNSVETPHIALHCTMAHVSWALPWLSQYKNDTEVRTQKTFQQFSRNVTSFSRMGLNTDLLSPFQYSLDAPSVSLTDCKVNQIIRQDLLQLHTFRTWLAPPQLPVKLNFLSSSVSRYYSLRRYVPCQEIMPCPS